MAQGKLYLRVKYAQAGMFHSSFPEETQSDEEAGYNSDASSCGQPYAKRSRKPKGSKMRSMAHMAPAPKLKTMKHDTFTDLHVTLHQAARDGNAELIETYLNNLSPEVALQKVNQFEENKLAPLHYAARYNHGPVVQLLLERGADVNIKGEDSLTPLHFSARYGYNKLMRQQCPIEMPDTDDCQTVICKLVSNGAIVNCKDDYGMSPLHYAAVRGNEVATDLLLCCPNINVEVYDNQAMTPLHCASNYNHPEIVEKLLSANAEPRVYDENMSTPLHLAATAGSFQIVELLLQAIEKRYGLDDLKDFIEEKNNSKSNALHLAIGKCDLDIVSLLLAKGADVLSCHHNDSQPVHLAAVAGNVAILKCLVEYGAEVNCFNFFRETPLHKAAAYNAVEAIDFLLNSGAQIETRDNSHFTPLLIAAAGGHVAAIERLMTAGANIDVVDRMDQSVIFLAARGNHPKALSSLLEHENAIALVNRCDRYDNSPLHIAALKGFTNIVEILLSNEAEVDRKNEQEQTPLHLTAINGHTQVATQLLNSMKGIINVEDENSNTPLHLAALAGHYHMVTLLINAGANIEARNCHLWTALDCATSKGWKQCCLILLTVGCPVDAADKSKTTPLHLAAREGHRDVLKLLLRWGANISQCDKNGKNCLDIAIDKGHEDVAREILASPEWEKVLRNETDNNKFGIHQTPLRRLIRRMPDVAELVFDKCVKKNGYPEDHVKLEITYNYEFLDDVFSCYQPQLYELNSDETETSSSSSSYGSRSIYDVNGHIKDKAKPYTDNKEILKYNHPLMLMVTHNRQALLNHPLCMSLLQHKWDSYGRYVYYSNLFIFVLFLMFLTIYIITAVPPCPSEDIMDPNCCWFINSTCQPYIGKCEQMKAQFFPEICRNFIYVLTVIHLIKEIYQMHQNGARYLNLENFLEWSCYLTALLFVVDITECSEQTGIREVWQWELGSLSIFFAWMVFVMFISKFPLLGIYVIMFLQILSTFANFSFVFFLFIVGFALAFHSLLINQNPFETPGESLLKTTVMMVGEFEFDNIFNDPDSKVYFKGPSYLLFVLFLLVMTIIIMNLLVGLAVDDIKGVQEQAQLKKLTMKVELVLTVERILPTMALRRCVIKQKKIKPNDNEHMTWLVKLIKAQYAKPITNSAVVKSSLEELEAKQSELSKQLKCIQDTLKLIQKDTKLLNSMLETKLNNGN